MTNKESAFKEGFIKKAQEYGFNIKQAEYLFSKKANMGGDVASWAGRTAADLLPPGMAMDSSTAAVASPFVGGVAGAGLGGLLGGGLGALNGKKDEKGETHRFRNALVGALTGGGLGGLAGGAAGLGVGGAVASHPTAYMSGHIPGVIGNSLEEAARPAIEGARGAVETGKTLWNNLTR